MNDFFSNESTYSNGVPATYRAADLPEYCGNPLIEALSPMYIRYSGAGLTEIQSSGGPGGTCEANTYPRACRGECSRFLYASADPSCSLSAT